MAATTGEEFGQIRPPLSVTIKGILDRYPDGQIFKEMIQNADDAGASKVQFFVDSREHGCRNLVKPELDSYQGPALISANDAKFTADDWEGIQKLQQSIKEDDPFKIGRFGIGFNSVYHLTDLPSILSGDKIGFLEPSEQVWKGESGRSFYLRDLLNSDHLTPFHGIADFTKDMTRFPKTLFRFPLRRNVSGLSRNVFSVEKVNKLIDALRSEAKLLLLFLRSVHTIEVYNIDHFGSPVLSFQTKIADAFVQDFTKKRASFLKELKSYHASREYNFSKKFAFTCKFDVCVYDASTTQTTTNHWLVSNQIDSTNATVRKASINLKVFPWVGVAVELDNPENGRIFCVLPLPIETASNLPVHVNGTFGINDDRRSLKWPGVERKNDLMAGWNQMLVNELIPSCYIDLLLEAKLHFNTSNNFYKAWPEVELLIRHVHWNTILSPVLSALWEHEVILCEMGWVIPSDAVYTKSGIAVAQVVKTALKNCRVKMAEVPPAVWKAFSFVKKSLRAISPEFVRNTLRAYSSSYTSMNQSDKLNLLKYCLSDGQYCNNQLVNLQLLLVANGMFVAFENNAFSAVYICSKECPRELLPNLDHKLVDLSNDSDLHIHLMRVAQSDTTQLKKLNVLAVSTLLDEALPSLWRNANVIRLPDGQFKLEWFEAFWAWLRKKNLSYFQSKLIFPVLLASVPVTTQFSVVRLTLSQPVLYIPSHVECSHTMFSVLNKFGIKYCTQESFPFVEHKQLKKYISVFSTSTLLGQVASKPTVALSLEEAKYLRKIFSEIELPHSGVLQDLQIFSSCTSNSLYSLKEASQQSVLKGVIIQPSKTIDLSVLPSDMIIFSSDDYYQKMLLSKLGHSALNDVNFLTRHILPKVSSMGDQYIDPVMTRVLDMYQSLCCTSDDITTLIKNLSFVKVASGERKCPSELYDPKDECISNILQGENVFPCAPYNASRYINILKLCGLCTSVNPQKVLDIIYSISTSSSSSPQKVAEVKMYQAKAILQAIASSDFKAKISGAYKLHPKVDRGYFPFNIALMLLSTNRSWLPVVSERPSNYPACLCWKGEDFTSHFISLNGSVCVTSSNSPSLTLVYGSQAYFTHPCEQLELDKPIQHIVPHLKHIIASKEQIPASKLMPIVQEVYSAMLEIVQEGTEVDKLNKLKTMKEWVYIKKYHKFVGVSSVALKQSSTFSYNIEPYLYILPDSISAYSQLFKRFGMSESVTRLQIVSMLGLIKEEVSVNSSSVSPVATWSTVMAILNWLTENGTKEVDLESTVYIPAESNSEWPDLQPTDDLVYADTDFVRNFVSSTESCSKRAFIHSRINQSLAKCLHITPLSEELDISEDTFEDAGQHEPLTLRLKNILRDYKDGLTIIKELIQNADDAEATEVNICYDARTHTTERGRLFFPDMCEAHGPALIIQNDSTFSDEDFENIQRLASATKQSKRLKIGKFGVGFCSVYHITDVPSFVSRDRLYIFDPTLEHLRKAVKNPSRPGKKVSYLAKIITSSKQMDPYDGLFKFRHDREYKGTMFRLPFRKSISELSGKCYSESTVRELVEGIQQCGDKLLLFLQHVKRITVQRFDPGQRSPEILYELYKPAIPQTLSLDNSSIVAVKSTCEKEKEVSTNHWLVATHTTTDDGGKTAVANVACLLNESDNHYTLHDSLSGEVFCYLPLSQISGLPVHVSCNFAVINNRRGIWTSELQTTDTASEVQWNVFLMSKVIPVAYVGLLCDLMKMFETNQLKNYNFHSLWPLSSKLQHKNPWENFLSAFYELLLNLRLFYSASIKKWMTFRESKFLDSGILCDSSSILEILCHLKLPLVDLPSPYRKSFCFSSELLKENDFIKLFFCSLSEVKAIQASRNEVVYHLLKTYASQKDTKPDTCQLIKENLSSHACIPTTPDGAVLKKCTEVIDPNAAFARLFDECDNWFPVQRLTDDLAIAALKQAGMMHSSLPWDLVIDRAQFVSSLMQTDEVKALKRVRLILRTVRDCNSGEPPSSGVRIDSIPFLPVMRKPDNYPLHWYGVDFQLLSGNKLVSSGLAYQKIAGSQVAFLCEDLPMEGGCGTIGSKMQELLHLRKRPTLQEVIAHLETLIHCFESSNPPALPWISQSCKEIYNFFESMLESDEAELDLTDLKNLPCIWNGKTFLKVDTIATSWKMKDGPYLYTTPPDVVVNKKLSSALGIKEKFGYEDAVKVLDLMKEKFGEEPIVDSYRELIAELLDIFEKVPSEELKTCKGKVYLLDTQDILRKSSDLRYNDAPWLPVESDCVLVSCKLSRELATNLGVQLVRSALLDQYVSKKPNSFGVSFGQHESLTLRIRNIIREYSPDITILKELLQNADDAKAKKMYIILDKRTHNKESVISKEWQELQGPALLVWNDSIFTEGDLQGIQELGLGSKRSDAEAIGQFGIGFNVVYHLTDCPSFVTGGDTLCVLDPHCKYVPEAKGEKALPGGRYDELKDRFWDHFSDMASAYLRNGIDDLPHELLGGSLFRFPLRHTYDMVESSQILETTHSDMKKPQTVQELYHDLRRWMSEMKQAMFFLNHVTEMKFMVIDEKSSKLETVYHCKSEREISEEITDSLQSLQSAVSNFTEKSGCKSCVACYPLTVTESSPNDPEKGKSEKWLIQQGIGDLENKHQSWQFIKTAKPRHGIAAPLQTSKESKENEMKLFCFLPLHMTSDVPVHINGNFALHSNRRYLWRSSDPNMQDDKARWNSYLFKAIASSYANFLSNAKTYYVKASYTKQDEAISDMKKYYSLFPKLPTSKSPTDPKSEDSLAWNVYKSLIRSNADVMSVLVHTHEGNGIDVEWHPPSPQEPSNQVHYWSKTSAGLMREIMHPILQDVGLKITEVPYFVMCRFNKVIAKLNKLEAAAPELEQKQLTYHEEGMPALEEKGEIPSISRNSVFEYYTKHSVLSSTNNMQPRPIAETLFRNPERFLTFIKFLVGEKLLPECATSSSDQQDLLFSFPDSHVSHYLLLTADGILRAFDEDSKSFKSNFSDLFPNHLDKFLHPSLNMVKFPPTYFISGESEDEVVLALILEIFEDTLPNCMKDSKIVLNASSVIIKPILSKYWKCFGEDLVFYGYRAEILKHWALLLTTDDRLFSASSDILPAYSPSGNDFLDHVFAIMTNLHMPFVDTNIVTVKIDACPELSNQDLVLSNFSHTNMKTPLTSVLKEDSLLILIQYFSESAQPEKPEWVNRIKSLPLFKDISGEYREIKGNAVVWPSQFPCISGYESWSYGLNTAFLEVDAEWTSLGKAEQLSITNISTEEIYIQYIFKNFNKLDETERYNHLEHIRDYVYQTNIMCSGIEIRQYTSEKQRSQIRSARKFITDLKTLKCIGSSKSELRPVSDYCDHTLNIFQVFSSHFPSLPEQLKLDEWLVFFRQLDLKVKLKNEEYLELCQSTSEGKFEHVSECANALIEYLFSDEVCELWYKESSFLAQIAEIPFAVAANPSSVNWSHPACYPAGQLVPLNGAAPHTLTKLLWTVKPLIQLPTVCTDAYKREEIVSLLQHLGIIIKAEVKDVVSNVKNICADNPRADENLFNNYPEQMLTPMHATTLCEIISENLQFLDQHCFDGAIQSLRNLPCIPVHCDLFEKNDRKVVLVKPNCVLMSLSADEEQFHPFLHSTTLSSSPNVFKTIGVKQGLELHHMQVLLEKIFTYSDGIKLDPNAKKHVKGAIEHLGNFLRQENQTPEASVKALSPLYLPNTSDELKLSTTLLYNDTPSFYGHMKIDFRGTPYSHFDILEDNFGLDARKLCQLLPKEIRPLGMSAKCRQVPDEGCERADEDSELAIMIMKFVQDSNPLAVAKVFKRFMHHDTTQNDQTEKIANNFLSSLKVTTMHRLKTRIMLDDYDKVIGRVKSDVYLDTTGSEPKLYVDSNLEDEDEPLSEICEKLYQKILDCVLVTDVAWKDKTTLLNIIGDYLKAATASKKMNVLSKYRIEAKASIKVTGLSVEIGAVVPECYHHRLDQDPDNILHPMEYVGYEDKEGHLIVAQIVHLDMNSEQNLGRRYRIYTSKTDPEGKVVSVLDLYKFQVGSDVRVRAPFQPVGTQDSALILHVSADRNANLRKALYEGRETEIKRRVCEEIMSFWHLHQKFRDRGFRRLYLKWHPDKNLDNQSRAYDIFNFLKKQIEHLEKNGCLLYKESDAADSKMTSRDSADSSPEPDDEHSLAGRTLELYSSNYNEDEDDDILVDSISDNFPRWDMMAKFLHQAQNLEEETNTADATESVYLQALEEFDKKKENPDEGARWLKQAEIDFNVLCKIHSTADECNGYSHVCFMAHQVAEKSLKGGVYALCGMDGRDVTDPDLTKLVYALKDACPNNSEELSQHSTPLQPFFDKTRYPNHWPDDLDAPSEHYQMEDADEAKKHAEAVLEIMKAVIAPEP